MRGAEAVVGQDGVPGCQSRVDLGQLLGQVLRVLVAVRRHGVSVVQGRVFSPCCSRQEDSPLIEAQSVGRNLEDLGLG